MPATPPKATKKSKKHGVTTRATYEQWRAGLLSSHKKKKVSSKITMHAAYPVKKNMIIFETLNKIHALVT